MAMRQATEYVRGLRYTLRMFGIPVAGPAFIFGDNQSVLCNTSMPESNLKKKAQRIAHHCVCEGCAADEWRTKYVHTSLNLADLMTKPLSGEKKWGFIRMLLHHILLGEEKYGPGSEPQWKAGGTRYPNLYKALLEEPSRTRRTKLLEDNSRGKTGDGRFVRRPARARIRNQ